MSYARWGHEGSDVYVIRTDNGYYCHCSLQTTTVCGTPEEMIVHLAGHRRSGDTVPVSAILRLWDEIRFREERND